MGQVRHIFPLLWPKGKQNGHEPVGLGVSGVMRLKSGACGSADVANIKTNNQ